MLYYNFDVSDQYGYYMVGPTKFYSKFEAVKAMQRTGIHLTYHFHDEVYSKYDWAKEPTASLDELYRRRCQQLREKYDYLVLCYSGGGDSQNILDTFVKHDIYPDEIMTYHNYSVNPREHMTNKEVIEVAYPRAKAVVDAHPHIKHRLIDFGPKTHDFFINSPDMDRIVDTNWSMFSPGSTVLCYIHQLDQDYLDMIAQGKRVGFVIGFDKPRVWEVDGRWCHRFLDIPSGLAVVGSDIPTEMFYWSPDAVELLIKQCHVIKNYMKHATPDSPFITTTKTGRSCKKYGDQTLWLNDHGTHTLLYPSWDITTYSAGKDPSKVLSRRDSWFVRHHNDPARINWHNRVQGWWNSIPDYWKNDPVKGVRAGPKNSWTVPYFLGD